MALSYKARRRWSLVILLVGLPVYIVGAEGDVKGRLNKLGLLEAVALDHVVTTRQEALEKASAYLDELRSPDQAPTPA